MVHRYTIYEDGSVVGPSGKKLKPVKNNCGYGRITLCYEGRRDLVFVHRLVAEAFLPHTSDKDQINHKDKNKYNNAASNLEWVTCSENHMHAFSNGRRGSNPNKNGKVTGAKNASAKLTDDLVLEIHRKTQQKIPQRVIASEYGVNQALIYRIAHKQVWRHLWL